LDLPRREAVGRAPTVPRAGRKRAESGSLRMQFRSSMHASADSFAPCVAEVYVGFMVRVRVLWLTGVLALMGMVIAFPAAASDGGRSFRWGPCPTPFPPQLTIDCGFLTVPESRSEGGARQDVRRSVVLPVAIIRSADRSHAWDPVVFIEGGPSFNALESSTASFLAAQPFAAHRDVVFYNPRGVGFATPRLGCPEFDKVRQEAFPIDPLYMDRSIPMFLAADAACRQRLADAGIDLRAYDSAADAADLNDLRLALGYRQWNVFALSAGGVVALTAMRLYPSGIRSVALDSPVGNQWQQRGPDQVRAENRMLEKVFAGCAADAACDHAYPNLRARFYSEVYILRRHPVVLNIPIAGGTTFPITFDGDLVLNMGYCLDPICAAGSPRVLDEAARGDIASYAADVFGGPLTPAPPLDPVYSEGKSAVFHCRDYITFEPDSELLSAARELPEWRDTLLSLRFTYVPTQTKQACERWHVGRASEAQHRPVASPIPTLLLTGVWDGVIGPPSQDLAVSHLANVVKFEFPGIGHGTTFSSPCPSLILGEFVDAPAVKPDSSCIASMPDVDFTPSSAAAAHGNPGERLRLIQDPFETFH
jgi:pimeloyl-ACP methyl ester carboxylesterase